jgi:hypothetical protein
MRSILLIASLFLFTLVACGGRQAPMHDLSGTVPSSDKRAYSMSEVRNAITRAGVKRGWAMHEKTPGHIIAKLDSRSHYVSLDIRYDQQNYSLHYDDSTNMNYNGTSIHPKYNKWIGALNRAIQLELINISAAIPRQFASRRLRLSGG